MASSGSSAPGSGARRPRAAGRAIYGGLPESGPPGFAPRLLELADELRREGLAVGTSELLDAFHVLGELSWTGQEDFREALAATLAKSQEDRRVFEIVFDRFFFRAVEREAVERGLREERFASGGEEMPFDLDDLRERIREAVRGGSDGEMRDMARLAIAAFGRQGEGAGGGAAAAGHLSSRHAGPCARRSGRAASRCAFATGTAGRGARSSTCCATCPRA